MQLMARYPDKYFDLAIVDPPYGIGMDGNAGLSEKYNKKEWDSKSPKIEYFIELKRVSKNQIIWGANHFIEKIPNANSSCYLIWDKRENVIPERTFACGEMAYTSFNSPIRIFRHYWDGFLKKQPEDRLHPTQKPVALYKWLLDKYAKQDDKILDTHLGSGSIAIACHDYGFDLTACELDKEYFDKAIERINNHKLQQRLF
jgi:site-specific DNA-methyltransferase (adenine-specific)